MNARRLTLVALALVAGGALFAAAIVWSLDIPMVDAETGIFDRSIIPPS